MLKHKLLIFMFFSMSVLSYFVAKYVYHTSSKLELSSFELSKQAVISEIGSVLAISTLPSTLQVVMEVYNVSLPQFIQLSRVFSARDRADIIIYSALVSPGGLSREEFEAESSETHGFDVAIKDIPDDSSDILWPIFYIYPENDTQIGRDMYTSDLMRTGIQSMMNSSGADLSNTMAFMHTDEPVLFVLQPVFKKENSTILRGLVARGIRSSRFLTSGANDSYVLSLVPSSEVTVFFSRKGGDIEFVYSTDVYSFDEKKQNVYPTVTELDKSDNCSTLNLVESVELYICVSDPFQREVPVLFIVIFMCGVGVSALVTLGVRIYMGHRDASKEYRFKTRFIADMSHEIRTPINGMMVSAELLKGETLSPLGVEYVDTIRSCGTTLMSMMNSAVDLSSTDDKGVGIKRAPVELRVLCHDSIRCTYDEYVKHASQTGNDVISLILEMSPMSVSSSVDADSVKIAQVLSSLVSNALKYTDKGYVSVYVDLLKAKRMLGGSFTIKCSVIDTGIGISKDDMKKIFTPFQRLHPGREAGGTGLGLSVSNRIVKQMGGNITCKSKVGAGSTFSFTVPTRGTEYSSSTSKYVHTFERECVDAGVVQDIQEQAKFDVLVVDDILVNRRLMQRMLESLNCRVYTANDGLQALDMCKERRFFLILMDNMMPVMNGVEATKRIRSQIGGFNTDTRIYFLTASVTTASMAECYSAGGSGYLVKPVPKEKIQNILSENDELA